MFTTLGVENFLSLKKVHIELVKVNIFVGPNASGKSNIAKVFRLVAKHAREGVPVLEGYASFRDLSFNFNPFENIYVALGTPIGYRKYTYTLELNNEKYIERIFAHDRLIISYEGGTGELRVKDETLHFSHGIADYYGAGRVVQKSILLALPSDIEAGVRELASSLGRISVHSFAPDVLRLKNHVTMQPFLRYHGENLARYLLYLYTEKRRDFGRIEETLRNMIPEVEEIIPHIEEANVEIWIKLKGLEEPLKPHNISDGTLRILAIISALYGGSSLVVLEEPENCVHPYLLETLMDLARDSPSQIIMTTHSPYLLDHAKPEEVYLVRKEGLETKVEKLTSMSEMEQVKRFLEEGGTLGEAWYSKIIGGTP